MKIPPVLQVLFRTAPLPLVRQAAQLAYVKVVGRHPGLFERLGAHAGKLFAFAPADLPFEFAIRPAEGRVRIARPGRILRSDVKIAGPIVLLLALAEGRADGDAEFFGRQLTIEGDMEAVLALRNALEDCRIDFAEDLAPARGPLRQPVSAGLGKLRELVLPRKDATWN